jgi:hypothetical protein
MNKPETVSLALTTLLTALLLAFALALPALRFVVEP